MVKHIMTAEERIELAKKSRRPRVLDRLSRDDHDWVRYYVARNPNTPLDILSRLSQDEVEYVRRHVAENTSTPLDILNRLSQDKDKSVREGVAGNPNTPVDILDQLSRDESEWVRKYVARNHKWKAVQKSGLLAVARSASKWLGIL